MSENALHARYCAACGQELQTANVIGGLADDPLTDGATGVFRREDGGACVLLESTQATVFVHANGEGSV